MRAKTIACSLFPTSPFINHIGFSSPFPAFPIHSLYSPFSHLANVSKSPKHCAKQGGLTFYKSYKKLVFASSAFCTTVLTFIFLLWLILHPANPQFSLTQTDIYRLDLSGPHLLNSSIQLTLLSIKPNKKVGVYYDGLQAYAAYKGQQITVDTFLPPFYQGHEESNLFSIYLQGTGLPVAPSFGYEVERDQTAGRIVLNMKVNGKLRWKVRTWVSGRYRFNVNCVSVMAFGPNAPTAPLNSVFHRFVRLRC